jgi:hypothetical protein
MYLAADALSFQGYLLFTIIYLPVLALCGCFHHNGTQTTDLYHAPCSNDTSNPLSSICCAIERSKPADTNVDFDDGIGTADECLVNGICMNRWRVAGKRTISFWREECTERDWERGLCLDVCTDGVSFVSVC